MNASGKPTRYRVTFKDIDGKFFGYSVCTWLDESKAVVLATTQHLANGEKQKIYEVARVERIGDGEPHTGDVLDRMEW